MNTRNLPEREVLPARLVGLTTSPPSVGRLFRQCGDPGRLTNLCSSATCYRDNFVFFSLSDVM
jgi:hypothetical protein